MATVARPAAGNPHPRSGQAPRAWQRMLSGRRLDLLNPSPMDIEIEDIAHGLARVARWNGQTLGDHAFSVAQHCALVEEIFTLQKPDAPREHRLAALLHDAPEYVVGDLISPFKAAVGIDYKAFEIQLLAAIHVRFGLRASSPRTLTAAIKKADMVAAHLEASQLAGFTAAEAAKLFGALPAHAGHLRLEPLPAIAAQALFLERFKELSG